MALYILLIARGLYLATKAQNTFGRVMDPPVFHSHKYHRCLSWKQRGNCRAAFTIMEAATIQTCMKRCAA